MVEVDVFWMVDVWMSSLLGRMPARPEAAGRQDDGRQRVMWQEQLINLFPLPWIVAVEMTGESSLSTVTVVWIPQSGPRHMSHRRASSFVPQPLWIVVVFFFFFLLCSVSSSYVCLSQPGQAPREPGSAQGQPPVDGNGSTPLDRAGHER
jgi:hypothetical protein